MAASIWRGRLAFGLVSIPVRLHKAARRERVRFHHVYRAAESRGPQAPPEPESAFDEEPEPESEPARPAPSPTPVMQWPKPAAAPPPVSEPVARVRNMQVGEVDEAPIERPQVLKGYEVEKDRYVTFDPRELAALRPKTSTELTIAEFVQLQEIDPTFFETSYYAVPDKGGEKPYALLFAALKETGYAAVGLLAMHGREHATVIRPGRQGLIIHTLFYANEVRADEEYRADPTMVNSKELDLAKRFVTALAASFEPAKLKDTFEEQLQKLIHERAGATIAAYQHGEVTQRAPVVDIIAALKKSLEMARKPPSSEKSEEKAAKPRQRRPRPKAAV